VVAGVPGLRPGLVCGAPVVRVVPVLCAGLVCGAPMVRVVPVLCAGLVCGAPVVRVVPVLCAGLVCGAPVVRVVPVLCAGLVCGAPMVRGGLQCVAVWGGLRIALMFVGPGGAPRTNGPPHTSPGRRPPEAGKALGNGAAQHGGALKGRNN
jgi:hypothetical protein